MTLAGHEKTAPAVAEASNGITALRLGLALAVIYSHSYDLTGSGPDPLQGWAPERFTIGTTAVLAFFALSGWLLVTSRQRTGRTAFLRNRSIRIFPGFWVCLAVSTFVFAPLGGVALNLGYIFQNAALVIRQGNIGDLFATNPYPLAVNGSLETLAPEFACYLALMLCPLRYLRVAPLGVIIAVFALAPEASLSWAYLLSMPVAFASGALVGAWNVPLRWGWLGLIGAVAAFATGHFLMWGVPLLAWGTVWAGLAIPLRWKVDVSYGVYVYAFPLGQLLVLAGVTAVLPLAGLTVLAVLPVAWLSWQLVESPALRLKTTRLPSVAGTARSRIAPALGGSRLGEGR